MEESLTKLKKILKNLKKIPGRLYSEKENFKLEFELGQLKEKDEKKIAELRLEFSSTVKKIKEYLNESVKNPLETMAAFSLETVSKALPLFAGNHEELESFLITAELIEKTLAETAKQDFLQYVYHAKLTSGVRTAIGSYAKPEKYYNSGTKVQRPFRNYNQD